MSQDQASASGSESPGLVCLAYMSSASPPLESAALEHLVAASARANAARGVTGMLCYYDGSFLQFLEGPGDEVDTLLRRIATDPRHIHLMEVYRQAITRRAFPKWSMALVKPEALGDGQQALLENLRRFVWETPNGPAHQGDLEALLSAFRAWLR